MHSCCLPCAALSPLGKSTIAALTERFYDIDQGEILIDNHPIKSLDPSWLRGSVIGFINQEPVLFATTVMENIRYGRPSATDDEVCVRACVCVRECACVCVCVCVSMPCDLIETLCHMCQCQIASEFACRVLPRAPTMLMMPCPAQVLCTFAGV